MPAARGKPYQPGGRLTLPYMVSAARAETFRFRPWSWHLVWLPVRLTGTRVQMISEPRSWRRRENRWTRQTRATPVRMRGCGRGLQRKLWRNRNNRSDQARRDRGAIYCWRGGGVIGDDAPTLVYW